MAFKDNLAQDATKTFLNSDEFAEEITYTPKGGIAKVIKALVNRKRIDPAYEDAGRVLLNQFEIFIANDETSGVASINKGEDLVSLAEVIGGISIDWVVADILGQDEGAWHLLLQK
ncbi:MAG: hypothetical protein WC315_07650 [Candidatus Omnitrophota bacterium]|jgi:hypothetical protein